MVESLSVDASLVSAVSSPWTGVPLSHPDVVKANPSPQAQATVGKTISRSVGMLF